MFVLGVYSTPPEWTLPAITVEAESLKKRGSGRRELGPNFHQKSPGQRSTLNDFLQGELGVSDQVSCAFCGSRRLSVGGHRGEHVTILVDGLPLYSTIGNFYGIDGASSLFWDSVELTVGSGNSGDIPEAIAGSINIRTWKPEFDELFLEQSATHRGDALWGIRQSQVIDPQWSAVWGVQSHKNRPWDVDENLIYEFPARDQMNYFLKVGHRTEDSSLRQTLRWSQSHTLIQGGHKQSPWISSPPPILVNQNDFEERDVRKRYLGHPSQIRDQITATKSDWAWHGDATLGGGDLSWGLGWTSLDFNAIYMHGFDYRARDEVWAGSIKWQANSFWFGVDGRLQTLSSQSQIIFQQLGYPSDTLAHEQGGIFAGYQTSLSSHHKLMMVGRWNEAHVFWKDLDRFVRGRVFTPRFRWDWEPLPTIKSSIAFGKGYRVPLTLFESQHGTNEYGMELGIQHLEESDHLQYSLTSQTSSQFRQFSLHASRIWNMAYGQDRAKEEEATLFQNSKEPYILYNFFVEWTWEPLDIPWSLSVVGEKHWFPNGYTRKLPVAFFEDRWSFSVGYRLKRWQIHSSLRWTGPRDLSRYADYHRHFNRISQVEDENDINFGLIETFDPKWQSAPSFFTVDLNWTYQAHLRQEIYFNIENLFDYTQTRAGDTPLTWHVHGSHYHLDQFHIWGPLTGRRIWLGWRNYF